MIISTSTRGLTFGPEAESTNEAAHALREKGVRAVVVLMHAGAEREQAATSTAARGCHATLPTW